MSRTVYLHEIGRQVLDRLPVDAVVLCLASARQPPPSLAGWVDWRLNGELSRLLLAGDYNPRGGERLLFNTAGRLPAPRVFLFHWQENFDAREVELAAHVTSILDIVARAGAEEIALEIPAPASSIENMVHWQRGVRHGLAVGDHPQIIHLLLPAAWIDAVARDFQQAQGNFKVSTIWPPVSEPKAAPLPHQSSLDGKPAG